ncbi:MAG: hypothetical protein V1826_01320 [bacterium]
MKKVLLITIVVLVVVAVGLLLAYQLGKKAPGVYAIQDGKIYKLDANDIEFRLESGQLVFGLPPDYPKLKANAPFMIEMWDICSRGFGARDIQWLLTHGYTLDHSKKGWSKGADSPPEPMHLLLIALPPCPLDFDHNTFFSSLTPTKPLETPGQYRVITSNYFDLAEKHVWTWQREKQPFPYRYRYGSYRPFLNQFSYDEGIPTGVYLLPSLGGSLMVLVPIVFE